jgi:uncharacterized protein YciI
MTRYVLGLYRRVPGRPTISEAEAERIQEGHLAMIRHLSEAGEVLAAGPFEEDTDLRGVLLFATGSVERARDLVRADPAVVNGRLHLDLHTWYAPSGLRVAPVPPDPTLLDFSSD